MTLQTLKQGFALMGATLTVSETNATVSFKGITMSVDLTAPDSQIDAALYFLNISMPGWIKMVKEALSEEKKA